MIPIDRTEIELWGKQYDAKGSFPKLLSKLIRETTHKSTFLQMPSGTAINVGGWDGIVSCQEKTNFVPDGISLWEIGTNGNEEKANKDYEKRKKDSLGFTKSDVTYVAVTTNFWERKDDWVLEKNKEGVWKDVKAYDSRDIAEWLENSPISIRWFAVLWKSYPYDGIFTAEEYWNMISIGPKGQLVPKIVTAGREIEAKKLLEFLSGEPALKAVKGATKEEAIAFIIASAMQFDYQVKELFFARSMVVNSENNFHGLRINKSALNLIANFDSLGKLYVAVYSNGHHVLVPICPDDNFNSSDIIILPRIDREGQIKALQEMGLSHEDAIKYSKEAGRDYTILKNLLEFDAGIKIKYSDNIGEIIPALLIGRWDETAEGDRQILEKLANESYDSYSTKLIKWLDVESPPLIKIGSFWRLTSPLNAWITYSKHLSPKDFETLKECFLVVMKEIDPLFEVDPESRQYAAFSGKRSLYSSWCREGLTQSLILIGLHGEKLRLTNSIVPQHWVDDIIKELLFNSSGDLWSSRNSEMPLIAEASPASFFESAYHSLSLDDKPIMKMFKEEDNWLSPQSNHTGLLWALEGLAWIKEFLLDASIILAKLASFDPGGKLLNRPINSLREIYLSWYSQTLAPFEIRMRVLEQIVKTEFETGWILLVGMISKGSEVASPTYKFRWRLFEKSFDPTYDPVEKFNTHSQVIDLLLKYYDFTERKLIDLLNVSETKQIFSGDRSKILRLIESKFSQIKIIDNSAWHELRSLLSKHRSFSDTPWALQEEELKEYEEIYTRLTPNDPIEKVIWMFNDYWPKFPEGLEGSNFSSADQEQIMNQRRVEGLRDIYENYGFEKVKELSMRVKEPSIYADIAAQIIDRDDEIFSMCEYLRSENVNARIYIQGFLSRKERIKGIEWIFELYNNLKLEDYNDVQLAGIFIDLEQTSKIWRFLETTTQQTRITYWKRINPRFWRNPTEDMLYGIDRLVEVSRYASALDVAYHDLMKMPSERLVELLEKAGTQKSDENRALDSYHATKVLDDVKKRAEIDRATLLKLEWIYLPILTTYGSSHKPTILFDELAKNPSFFTELLSWVYKAENDEKNDVEITEERRIRAKKTHDLLREWNQVPGVDESGNINETYLKNWISEARLYANEAGRLKVADSHIGQILAEYPESITPWPPKVICEIIETIDTQSIKSGYSTRLFNKRGSSVRGPFDGGNIERGHAKDFRLHAERIKYEFPKTADIFYKLASAYEQDAKRMDEMAERDELDN